MNDELVIVWLTAILVGTGGMVYVGRRRRFDSRLIVGRGRRWILWGVPLLVLAVGTYLWYQRALSNIRRLQSFSWTEKQCVIEQSKLSRQDYERPQFRMVFEARYQLVDDPEKLSRAALGLARLSSGIRVREFMTQERADSIRATYQKGSIVTCFVDPENPRRSILFRDTEEESWLKESLSTKHLVRAYVLPAGIAWLIFCAFAALRPEPE